MTRQFSAAGAALLALLALPSMAAATELNLPSYLYGDPIKVECMNRSSWVFSPPPPFLTRIARTS